jgi:hypothetical protein
MAIFYELIIVGATTPDDFIARVYDESLPAPVFRPSNRAVAADEYARLGFWLSLMPAEHGYFEFDDFKLEPARYLAVSFDIDKDTPPKTVHANVRRFVDRALATGDEDMALINNGDFLLLERRNGEVRRVPSSFWED